MPSWKPNTCQCVLIVDSNFNYKDYDQKCEIHKTFDGDSLLQQVLNHHKPILASRPSVPIGLIKTRAARRRRMSIKAYAYQTNDTELLVNLRNRNATYNDCLIESKRIKALGNGITNPDRPAR